MSEFIKYIIANEIKRINVVSNKHEIEGSNYPAELIVEALSKQPMALLIESSAELSPLGLTSK